MYAHLTTREQGGHWGGVARGLQEGCGKARLIYVRKMGKLSGMTDKTQLAWLVSAERRDGASRTAGDLMSRDLITL